MNYKSSFRRLNGVISFGVNRSGPPVVDARTWRLPTAERDRLKLHVRLARAEVRAASDATPSLARRRH